jgi:glutamine amidotransferase
VAYSNYGVNFVAAIQKDNIIGCQFHPEKSQKAGLKLLDNFCKGIM